jgi:Zn-dependent peptidase ImmA (M78 family)/transcriptional regulator with XRE-family HTH domain
MLNVGATLQAARNAAGLSPSLLARLAGLKEHEVRGAEEGRIELPAAVLDQCARVFGVRLDDLLEGRAGRSPLALLLRSKLEGQLRSIRELVATELHQGLGEFLRVVRDIADLEALLDVQPRALPKLPLLPSRPNEHPGENRARTLRAHLGLGIERIPSMRKIVERDLDVRVVWVTVDQLDRSVDGACTIEPRPAVLVNLLEPDRFPWRTRITLAHELCHLLFDEEVRTNRALVSPYGSRGIAALRLEHVEQDARAFAACFLAPADGVRRAVAPMDPSSEEAIRIVGSTFGVGRTVAINRLQHVFRLSDEQRKAMEMRAGLPYEGDFEGDAVTEPLGYRGGVLFSLVHEALQKGKLNGTRARRLLALTPADALPFADLDEAIRAPLISPAERMRRHADTLLRTVLDRPDLLAAHAEFVDAAWRVVVVGGGVGARQPVERGHLVLSSTGEIIEDHVEPVGEGEPSTHA